MVLTHYPELMTEKGIVLVRGDIIHPEAVSRFEASCCSGAAAAASWDTSEAAASGQAGRL